MNKNIELMRKDYVGAKLDSIGMNKKGDFHFILKKGSNYFGIAVNPHDFETFNYKEIKK
ncbi:hypothetical protein LCGC14_1748110 [marine sediment metagenome]|uniref:Uncharacterized protein n=1 Tax=marine sediment metagenome TaxID=412755 RepID=A0A0F9K444_9ZZZZ